MARNPQQTNEAILQAAHALVREIGVRAFSLDKVAKSAGVSKGGLIHHFPTREALLMAIQRQVFAMCDQELKRHLALEPDTGQKGRYLRAFLRCNLELIRQGIPNQFASMAELAIADPDVFAHEKEFFLDAQRQVENDGLDPVQAMIIANASDNLWMQVMFGVLSPDDPKIIAIHDRLLAMTR
jgi:AcrR family transcriptional regulator